MYSGLTTGRINRVRSLPPSSLRVCSVGTAQSRCHIGRSSRRNSESAAQILKQEKEREPWRAPQGQKQQRQGQGQRRTVAATRAEGPPARVLDSSPQRQRTAFVVSISRRELLACAIAPWHARVTLLPSRCKKEPQSYCTDAVSR